MNAETAAQLRNDPPKLSVSLWSLRDRVANELEETLTLLQSWGISSVETAGSFSISADNLKKRLNSYGMDVCSIVAPPIRSGRDLSFYREWANRYLDIFKAGMVVLQTLPENFERIEEKERGKIRDNIRDLLVDLACEMQARDVKLAFHCFPHDFESTVGGSLLSRLKQTGGTLNNLGLQLDTYWLRMANVKPSTYSNYVVHSVHLNERDENGNNLELGKDQRKCAAYVRPLLERHTPINWILENDSSVTLDKSGDASMIDTMEHCVRNWGKFWKELSNKQLPEGTPAEPSWSGVTMPARFVTETMPDNSLYETELNQALTEHLLGNDECLSEISYSDERVSYYIKKREQKGDQDGGGLDPEHRLYSMIWSDTVPGKQMIQIVGGAGAGKSTFIRYFYQFFLPHYERIVSRASEGSSLDRIHRDKLSYHVFLYADLRHEYNCLGEVLGKRLIEIAKKKKFTVNLSPGKHSENDVIEAISGLSKEKTDKGTRKWYISLILDNSDQLKEADQQDLINKIFNWISAEPSSAMPTDPVEGDDKRAIWRVVVPIRRDTRWALESSLHPKDNVVEFKLDPIDQDLLMEKRSELLGKAVSRSNKSTFVNLWPPLGDIIIPDRSTRPHFEMVVPSEKASELKRCLQIAHEAKNKVSEESAGSTIPKDARTIFDGLVGDSARRRLNLVRRVNGCPVFHARMREDKLSKFYFLWSLIRDGKSGFDPTDYDNPLLNLYALGTDADKSEAYSAFVGIHAIWLLKNEMAWDDVRDKLNQIGYPNKHLDKCQKWLNNKAVLGGVEGRFCEEPEIAKAHWFLLQEPAYTDCMAMVCAQIWNMPDKARPTDPLKPEDLLPRLDASTWFLGKIWKVEQYLSLHRTSEPDFIARCGDLSTFKRTREKLNLPVVTNMVASAYLKRLQSTLTNWPSSREVIDKQPELWLKINNEVHRITEESGEPDVLRCRPSPEK